MPENFIVIYSAAEEQYCTPLLNGFRARHPGIAVEFVFDISPALHARYLKETSSGQSRADVMWSSGMDLQMELVLADHAQPYHSTEAAALPAGSVYRDQAWGTTAEPLVTLVNRALFDTNVPAGSIFEITAALAREPGRYRGHIAAFDIEKNGVGFLALLHESRHTGHDTFLRTLAACRPQLFGSNPPLVEEISSGRAALGYHVLHSYATRAVRGNPALAIAASNSLPVAVSRIAFIPRSAPHPAAARLFIDYLLSAEGQRHLLDTGFCPVRGSTVSAAPIRVDRDLATLLERNRRQALLSAWHTTITGAAG
jgi:iron(III) transport system substrate-binding protein